MKLTLKSIAQGWEAGLEEIVNRDLVKEERTDICVAPAISHTHFLAGISFLSFSRAIK